MTPPRGSGPCAAAVAVLAPEVMKCVLWPLVGLAGMVPVLAVAAEKSKEESAAPGKPAAVIAVYDLDGALTEAGQPEPSLTGLSLDASRPLTLLDVTRSLGKAAADPAVKAVVLDTDGADLDFAQVQELRRRLLELRAAGKDVWFYAEQLSNATALLGTAANQFALMPEADCAFHGIHAESMYFKGLLDKAGVRAEVIHIGDFKSFGEIFYRSGPSDQARQQEERLVDSVFGQVVAGVAEARKLDAAVVRAIIDDGSIGAGDLVEKGVADHLLHRTDFVRKLRETYGEDADFDRGYELPDLEGPEIKGMMDVFKLMFSDSGTAASRKDHVAVVALEGDITDESIAPVRSAILRLAKEPKAKALVLRINSPGGSALASEVLWEATDEWKATGKPFVVSMGGVAASGGYYAACGADRIFAEAGTITGSIGVVGMKFVVGGAMDKLGVTTHTIQRGKSAGAMSMTRGFTEEEAGWVRGSMEKCYATFKKRVSEGRGKALKGDLEPLAGGRVYSGEDALGVGLVDQIGGLGEAIAHAAAEAKLERPEALLVPEPKSGLEGVFAQPSDDEDEEIIRASVRAPAAAGLAALIEGSALAKTLPAPARTALARLVARVEAFREARVLMIGTDLRLR